MKSPRSISFSANLYAETSEIVSIVEVSPIAERVVALFVTLHNISLTSPFTLILQFSREKSICIRPVPSEIDAKHIFPKERWSMTRPLIRTELFGAGMISSTGRNGEGVPSSILALCFERMFAIVSVASNLVANGLTHRARMRSSFLIRSRVSVE